MPEDKYHNKTIRERWLEWKERSGASAFRYLYNTVSVIVCVSLVGILLYTNSFLPPFGDPDNPANNAVPVKYIEDGVRDTGAVNIVAAMIFDYRGFDTFGESCVLFTAVCAVLAMLRRVGEPDAFDTILHEMEEPRHNVILKSTSFLLVSMTMVFGFYVILNGHLTPGGGFSGGAILGAALILYAAAYGTKRAREFINYRVYRRMVSCCIGFYAAAKGYLIYTGANRIESAIPLGRPGSLFSGGLILPLNIAVGLTVSCTVYVIYELFSKGELE